QVFDAKEKSAVLVRGHIDRAPEDLKKEAIAGLEQFNAMLAGPGAPESARKMFKELSDFAAMLLNDGKAATARLALNPATGELALDGELTGKPGTALVKY